MQIFKIYSVTLKAPIRHVTHTKVSSKSDLMWHRRNNLSVSIREFRTANRSWPDSCLTLASSTQWTTGSQLRTCSDFTDMLRRLIRCRIVRVVVLVLVLVLKESLRTNLKSWSWSLELKSLYLFLTLRSWSWSLRKSPLVVSLFLVFFSWHLQSRFLRNPLPNTHYMWYFTYLTSVVIVCPYTSLKFSALI